MLDPNSFMLTIYSELMLSDIPKAYLHTASKWVDHKLRNEACKELGNDNLVDIVVLHTYCSRENRAYNIAYGAIYADKIANNDYCKD